MLGTVAARGESGLQPATDLPSGRGSRPAGRTCSSRQTCTHTPRKLFNLVDSVFFFFKAVLGIQKTGEKVRAVSTSVSGQFPHPFSCRQLMNCSAICFIHLKSVT